MPHCFIFSNCKKSSNEEFMNNVKKLNIKSEDTLVFMNECYMLYDNAEYFKQFPQIQVVLRSCSVFGIEHFFGINSAMRNRGVIKCLLCICPTINSSITIVRGVNDGSRPSKATYRYDWIDVYRNATKHDPTTGYCCYYLAQNLMEFKPEDITLINFYGNDDSSTPKDIRHDWNFEDNWLKERTRVFC